MASTISIKVGPVTATQTFADDARVQAVLARFAQPPDGLSNQERLDYVLAQMVEMVLREARRGRVRELRDAAQGTAESEIGFG